MSDRIKNIVVTVLFLAFVGVLCVANILRPLSDVSYSERRRLKQLPKFTAQTVLDGTAFGGLDEFLTDQFVMRESFRTVKALAVFGIYGRLDNNSIAIAEGTAIKLEAELRERAVVSAAAKFSSLYQQFFSGSACYFALIPDANYYLAGKNGYPALDYQRMAMLLNENLADGIETIDLFGALSARDYYSTDLHWRQEKLGGVLSALSQAMGFNAADISSYRQNMLEGFYGALYGQSALPLPPDTLVYLTSDITQSASVYNLETDSVIPVYRPELFSGVDPYDVFLSGATPLLVIENPLCENDRGLILFRDSFGSSLAPLLIESYRTITVVDIRYMASALIGEYVDINGQDVLFMYSASLINNSEMLK